MNTHAYTKHIRTRKGRSEKNNLLSLWKKLTRTSTYVITYVLIIKGEPKLYNA